VAEDRGDILIEEELQDMIFILLIVNVNCVVANFLRIFSLVKSRVQNCISQTTTTNKKSTITTMPQALRNTVERFDKPSAYYHSKVTKSKVI